nr:M15 family metallopeptidase [Microbacterium bovistercoris]
MTVPDPHDPPIDRAPMTRRALRAAHERADAAAETPTAPIPIVSAGSDILSHPPIFKPPPPPLRAQTAPVRTRPVPLIAMRPAEASRPRHARRPRHRVAARVAMAAASLLVIGGGGAAGALALSPGPADQPISATADITASKFLAAPTETAARAPTSAARTPSPITGQVDATVAAPASLALCETPSFTKALAAHDDVAAIAAAGGGERFRTAVVDGQAPCVSLSDPTRLWTVVDKTRPFEPVDYAPSPVRGPVDVRSIEGDGLRADAATALTRMVKAAKSDGAGEIALESGYRSYKTQQSSYGQQVRMRGTAKADLVSARPGYSEHQSGLAGDLVPCDGGTCGTLDDLAGTPQGDWIVDHAWQYGWIIRYEKGHTDVSGYLPEPWHLRYIGIDLAKAYHEGGYHTLEEFFDLPAAPDYAG